MIVHRSGARRALRGATQFMPDLGDLAIAAAEPGRLRQAAAEILENHPDATPDEVLLWAEARTLPSA